MPANFTRLRIAGFKSFPEVASLEILPGLTGIVGPNGCGKSNVVEALRWAMGEASAKSLRGGEMDDVIFAGTGARPSRNIAEVTLRLEQTQGLAPPPFQDAAELEVSRRIERGSGSIFRVNGREARARDVQTLFADMATGARASAMVSQGRVGAIVGARPEERRSILEEAAGITGLHARRHEAELKLRATEANLARADDSRGQMEGQLEGLRRQAKQAARFRTLADSVRTAEAELLAIQRAMATAARETARAAHGAAEAAVALAVTSVASASARMATTSAALPPLRTEEGDARSALERARLAAQQATAESAQAEAALAAASQRRAQVARDLAHAEQISRDAVLAREKLAAEQARLAKEEILAPARLAEGEARENAASAALLAAEQAAEQATERAAEISARHRAAGDALAAAEQRARRLREQVGRLRQERNRIAGEGVAEADVAAALSERDEAERSAQAARSGAESADLARAAAQSEAASARDNFGVAEAGRTRLAAAVQGLQEALTSRPSVKGPGVVDALAVPPGLETAVGAALGDDIEAPGDPAAGRHWRALPPLDHAPALPEGVEALATLVGAPPELFRALSQVGLVEETEAGATLQPALRAGQTLVSRAGEIFRWDGFRVRAGAPTAAAIRLQQRNRLAELRAELAGAERVAADAAARRDAADAESRAATEAETMARDASREADRRLVSARDIAARIERQAAAVAGQLVAAHESLARAEADAAEADAAESVARENREAVADPAEARGSAERTRAELIRARAEANSARENWQGARRAAQARTERLRALSAELSDWQQRERDAEGRRVDLSARTAEAEQAHATLVDAPARLAGLRDEALGAAEAAEGARRRAADRLATAEAEATSAERALRAAESGLAVARETMVRREGEAAQADAAWGTVAERIVDRLGANPALPNPPAVLDADAEERARKKHERLARERENIGPVNMRAEIEAAAIEEQAAIIAREGAELTTAIAKLRGSIGHINREGREKLGQVFADIDRHFRALFETMFGGGRAHLALVGSDDPLLAGLEIFAQPPGKKLATLSLLSGGEQALTALSLIFAVFRCNPAPVCVLDEVDAPLDDANVERFCGLLEAMVRETGTRFLVVTHHQLTMARMDRLYGVTMQERGVSRLLSVDLSTAAELAEAPRLAVE